MTNNLDALAEQLLHDTISEAVTRELYENNRKEYNCMSDTTEAMFHLFEATAAADQNPSDDNIARVHKAVCNIKHAIIGEMMLIAHDVVYSMDADRIPDGLDTITLRTAESAMDALTTLHLMAINDEWDDLQFAKTMCTVGFDKLKQVATVLDLICYGEDTENE